MSVFLTEQLITRYSQITQSLIIRRDWSMKAVSKLKFKLINVKGYILLLGEFLDIKLDLNFSARSRTQNKYEIS